MHHDTVDRGTLSGNTAKLLSPFPNTPTYLVPTMFEPIICATLEQLATSYPRDERFNDFYGIWQSILSHLFPPSQGYGFGPLSRVAKDDHTPYLAYEVVKLIALPANIRTVLVVAIMDGPDWRAYIPSLEKEIIRLTDAAFSGALSTMSTATSKVFWIGAIGPHWQYGAKEDNLGQELKPSIGWHDTIHDEASYDDFQHLVTLIADI